MTFTLGLDLGTSSIGWALIDEENGRIIPTKEGTPGCGVRHFPEPIDPKKNTPNNLRRREKRGSRRVNSRRVGRRRQCAQILRDAGLLPTTPEDDAKLEATLRDQKGSSPQLRLYALRQRALTEPVSPHEFGRIVMHLLRRRGFRSNRKGGEVVLDIATDGSQKKGKRRRRKKRPLDEAIKDFRVHMTEHGSRSFGEHLYRIGSGEISLPQTIRQKGEARHVDGHQIRGRFLLRSMILEEFDLIYDEQRKHIQELHGETLRQKLRDIIFTQRDVTWSRRLIGRCECLPRQPRCPRANWHAQQFRIYKEVNNLRLHNADGSVQELTPEQRKKLIDELAQREKLEFDQMRTMLGLIESQIFNLEEGPRAKRRKAASVEQVRTVRGRASLKGNTIEAALLEVFGKDWNARLNEAQRARIREGVTEIADAEELIETAQHEWGLAEDDARLLATMEMPSGYASYSLEAMKGMTKEFRKGLATEGGIREYEARERCGFPDRVQMHVCKLLPLPVKHDRQPLTNNPLVNRALHEVRKVVNAIIREYGKPDKIVVELWREMKGSLQQRAEMVAMQNANRDEKEKTRQHLAAEFPEVFKNSHPSGTDVFAYRLWLQQGKLSPYSGAAICRTHLAAFFAGQGVLHIDHILPEKRSGDDSQNNKCLCFASENAGPGAKNEQTPREWLDGTPEYDRMLSCVATMAEHGMPWAKRRKFSQQEVKLDDFVARQMNDTAFIAREVRRYLQCLYLGNHHERDQRVKAARGATTAAFRWQWGLDTVLDSPGFPKKDRSDLRHHAIDAIVIALTNEKRVWHLAQRHRLPSEDASKFGPWPDFRRHVQEAVEKINVSHRVRRKVRGQLHDETHYGKRTEEGKYPYRKALTALTWAEIGKIRDDTVRELVKERVAPFLKQNGHMDSSVSDEGDSDGSKKKPPAAAWAKPLYLKRQDGRLATVIKRVRLDKMDSTIRSIRKGDRMVNVKPGKTHHLCLFKGITCPPGDHEQDAVFVDLLTAMERKTERMNDRSDGRTTTAIIEKSHPKYPNAEFWMSLSSGEMVLLDPDDHTTLYRFETAPSTIKQLRFRKHNAAAIGSNGRKTAYPWTLNPKARKVTVDPLGRIRWAND